MKRNKRVIFLILAVTVMGVFGLFGKASVAAFAEEVTEMQTEVPDENTADTATVEYQGLDEMPWIFKYMIFSVIGVAVLAGIAAIYCAFTPLHKRRR